MAALHPDLPSHASKAAARQLFGGALTDGRALVWLVVMALILGTARRMALGLDAPLTLDESWTGAIATAPDLATLVRRCLAELSGPVYYGLAWGWAKLAGVGDLPLRLPSVAAAVATPLLILRCGHPDRHVRLLWAGLAAIWLPGTLFAAEARPYGVMLLLGTAQVSALIAFLRKPSQGRALLWTTLSALSALTHYYTLPLSALQGLVILLRGREAWRCWPALLAFGPVAGWMAWHLPTLLSFAAPSNNWYSAASPTELLAIVPAAMFGLPALGQALLAAVALTSLWCVLPGGPRIVAERRDIQVALTGVGALALLVVLALVRPSFSPRYILAYMPAILFGLALWGVAWSRRWPWLPAALMAIFLLLGLSEARVKLALPAPRDHAESFEIASQAIAATHPRRLIIFFDGPGTAISDSTLLRDVGGFFLARAGQPVQVIAPAFPDPRTNPNSALPALADRRGDAILWIYDGARHGTRGARFPAAIERADPRWHCRDFGTGSLSVIACVQ
jgi:hypothetical protein